MVNVVVTTECNKNCPYCFTNKSKKSEMNIKTFRKLTEWFNNQNLNHIQLLGGEPLLHSNLYEFLEELHKKKIDTTLITNATITVDKKIPLHPSIKNYLINVSASTNNEDKKKLEMNLEYIRSMEKIVILGITIYDYNQKINYLFELCKKYKINDIRLDFSQPASNSHNIYIMPENYIKFRPLIIKILKKCKDLGIKPSLDCGICVALPNIFSKKEIIFMKKFCKTQNKFCKPVIDVFPDLSASYCFPLKNIRVKNVLKYDFYELRNIFIEKVKKYVDYDKEYQGMCIRNIINRGLK